MPPASTPFSLAALVQALSPCLNYFKSFLVSVLLFFLPSGVSSTWVPEDPSKSKSSSLSLSENPLIFVHVRLAPWHGLLSPRDLCPAYLSSLTSCLTLWAPASPTSIWFSTPRMLFCLLCTWVISAEDARPCLSGNRLFILKTRLRLF